MSFYLLSSIIGALTNLSLSIFSFVYYFFNKQKTRLLYGILCLTLFSWISWDVLSLTIPPDHFKISLVLCRILYSFSIFIAVFYIQFVLSVANVKGNKYILFFFYVSTAALFLSIPTPLFISGLRMEQSPTGSRFIIEQGPYYYYFIFIYYLSGLYGMFEVFKAHKRVSSELKLRLKYIIVASLVAFSASFIYFPTIFGINIPPLDNVILTIYTVIMAYAIVRHRLMDIEIIIKKGILYSVLMVAIIAEYSLLIFVGQYISQAALGANQLIATIITAFAIALGYKPLENFVTEATNQYFFKKQYDYQKTLKLSSEVMNLLTDIDRLVKLTTRIVCRKMELAEASTLVLDEPNHRYIVKAAESMSKNLLDMMFSDNHELFKYLFHSKALLTKEEIVNALHNKLILPDERKRFTAIKKEMDSLHAQVCIPCITRGKYMGNKLVAVFCLGEKKSGDMYSAEDIQLLTTLSNQAAVAVENAIMYSDLMKQFQELKNTRDQLVQADKLAVIGTMAAGIAHEIKNPLTSIQLYVLMMQKQFDDPEFRQKFNQMVPSEVDRLNKIVNDLTTFAKPAKLESEPAQINDILEKTLRLSEISFKKMNVKVLRDFGSVPNVSVNQQKMMQIFLNLIKNGAESMENGGTLTIKTYHDAFANKVCIDIKDEGHGITDENLKKLFAPFFTTKDKGTGLGLAITRRIVEEHKGDIKVKSKVGEGTTFTVELPVTA